MKLFKKIFLGLTLVGFTAVAQQKEEGIYARINTEKGNIIIELTYDKTPVTVANFISLAEGTNKSVDKKFAGKKYYDGLNFHRVIKDFMIQGGDPNGNGSGNPGYLFDDEFVDELKHNRAGTLSMANRGPATNGSQFFITHKATPHLDGRHTVFGYVTEGQDVVNAIEQGDKINTITFEYVGKSAEKFKAQKVFADYMKGKEKAEKEKQKKFSKNAKRFTKAEKQAFTTEEGIKIFVTEKGSVEKPQTGDKIFVDYSGYLTDGTLFDSSNEKVAEENFSLNLAKKNANAYQPLPYTIGGNQNMIKGFSAGINHLNYGDKALIFIPAALGYGSRAMGPIPANADLVFEIQLIQ